MRAPVAASVRSSPLAALGVLVACLAISSLGRRDRDELEVVRPIVAAPRSHSRVDLNTATAAELERLPRIGPALAGRIVEHRETYGPFRAIEELDDVSGIGPAILASVRDHVTISAPDRDAAALLPEEPPR